MEMCLASESFLSERTSLSMCSRNILDEHAETPVQVRAIHHKKHFTQVKAVVALHIISNNLACAAKHLTVAWSSLQSACRLVVLGAANLAAGCGRAPVRVIAEVDVVVLSLVSP